MVQEVQKSSSIEAKKQESTQKPNILPQKEVKKPVVMAAAKIVEPKKGAVKKEEPKKTAIKKPEPVKTTVKKAEPKKEVKKQEVKVQQKPIVKKPQEEVKQPVQEVKPPVQNELDPVIVEGALQEQADEDLAETLEPQVQEEQIQEEIIEDIEEPAPQKEKISLITKFQNKLSEYGLSIRELLLMLMAGVLSFVIMLLILTRRQDVQTRLKSKADFIDKTGKKAPTLVAKKGNSQKPNNQYFVFDKNVKQTGLMSPLTDEKKNYELSSYNPTIQDNSSSRVEPYQAKHVTSEYDIIQKILKEDTFIELTDSEFALKKEQEAPVAPKRQEVPEVTIAPAAVNTAVIDEPEILSSVEIAPQRGFMCVSYNGSINLIGYIFDDVFALYNFQQPKLENYNIKFRLSEKTPQGANFLVRVGKSKMLISVTKSSMNLEVAM